MANKILHRAGEEGKHFLDHFTVYLKWLVLSVLLGAVMGLISTAFYYALTYATQWRTDHPFLIWLLPVAGLFIAFLYQKFDKQPKEEGNKGTNMVLAAVNANEEIPARTTPLILVSTILSHLFGASVGREGAALQMGASLGSTLARLLKMKEADKRILIMTGMAGAFSALFGSPITAAIFSMEVISVGVMYYAALVPCVASALTAISVAKALGVTYAVYQLSVLPDFTFYTAGMTTLLGVLCAIFSILLCMTLILVEKFMSTVFNNTYIRIFVAGTFISLLTLLVGNQDYNGLGAAMILSAVMGHTVWYAFLLKLLFTAVSLAGGYRGGEIVPTLFMGACFGCFAASFLGMPAGLCAALGMIAVFCGVTNSPIASFIMGLELFGGQGIWFFAIVVAVSYMLSGYYGIYKSQLIIYSKYRNAYVRRNILR